MGQIVDERAIFFKGLALSRKIQAERDTAEWFINLTGRDLYEAQTITLKARNVVDKPVSLALSDTTLVLSDQKNEGANKEDIVSVEAIDIMTGCMVDGFSVVKLGAGWDFITIEPFWHIKILDTNTKGFITFIRIQHPVAGPDGKVLWFRRDYFAQMVTDIPVMDGDDIVGMKKPEIKFFMRTWPKVEKEEDFDDETKLKEIEAETVVEEIPFIPFVAFEWNSRHESFLIPAKVAFLELERVSLEISGQNTKHHTRKLYVTGIPATEREPAELTDEVNIIGTGDKAFYPDPHAEAITGFFREREDQEEFIENYTGVIPTEKITTLSGVSRITAMMSIIKLAKKIRRIFLGGMVRIEKVFNEQKGVESKKLLVNWSPLGIMIVDVNNQFTLLAEAHEKGLISDHEFRESTRMMLGL